VSSSSRCRAPSPEDGLVSRLGALLAVRRALPLGEASLLLEASIAGIRTAVPELSDRLAPLGMRVVEDSETLALLPHRTLALLADRAVEAETHAPAHPPPHRDPLHRGLCNRQATRRRIDEVRGVDSAETVSQLVEWGLLRRTGRDLTDSRAHLYQATAKLLEVTGATSLDELRARLLGMVDGDVRALDHPATSASGEPRGSSGTGSGRQRGAALMRGAVAGRIGLHVLGTRFGSALTDDGSTVWLWPLPGSPSEVVRGEGEMAVDSASVLDRMVRRGLLAKVRSDRGLGAPYVYSVTTRRCGRPATRASRRCAR
jgi:hypothetical protein